MMKVTWYGHACCGIEGGGSNILIDPFLTGNPQASITAEEAKADYIVVTHGHGDHYGDTADIAKRTDATVIANFEVSNYAEKEGCTVHPMHIGGGFNFPFGHLKLTIAHHGSSLPDGSYGGNPAGLVFTIGGKKFYHPGDTGLFYDMKLIGEQGLDLAILPIGDNFTMGPEDALRAIEFLRPKKVIAFHYNTFDVINQDVDAWVAAVKEQGIAEPVSFKPGDSITL